MTMKRVGSPVVALVATGVAVVLGLAGCGGGSQNTAGSAQSPVQSRPSEAQRTTQAPPTGEAEKDPTTSESVRGSGMPPQGEPALCRSAELALSLGRGSAAAGTYYRPLRFTNEGDNPCVLRGFPGVSYVAGEDGHQVGPAAEREGPKGGPVSLEPGEAAHAVVGFVQVRNYDPAACEPTPVRGLRVYPPGETAAKYVEVPGTGCAGGDIPGHQLTVRTVEPGSGGS
ncbi:hypothetical protein FHU38_004959 [Saccharomonospora amisosensis]|uniref:DUF4232 domain-containing protein n=1 Tax=Saccharomonospora amisosensis TaxID=1128677 RepID=A0A7X5ZT41_9PSEU|nr:DUF4232 domain-containing protein [Saccharomonospora amisosensis]NIJ14558.1 hypothetical protein [Saccharomonospora amisosensis]